MSSCRRSPLKANTPAMSPEIRRPRVRPGVSPSVLVPSRWSCPDILYKGHRSCLHTDTMATSRREPTWPGAPRGRFRSGGVRTLCIRLRTHCSEGKQRGLESGGSRILSLRFLASEANLICTEDSPASLAGWERALRMGCAQSQSPLAKTSVGTVCLPRWIPRLGGISVTGGPRPSSLSYCGVRLDGVQAA